MKNKAESKAAREISNPALIPAPVNFQCRQPLRPVKSKVTPGEAERNIQIIFQICFPEEDRSERLLTALTINLCHPDYIFKAPLTPPPHANRVQTCTFLQIPVRTGWGGWGGRRLHLSVKSKCRFIPFAGIKSSCVPSSAETRTPLSGTAYGSGEHARPSEPSRARFGPEQTPPPSIPL